MNSVNLIGRLCKEVDLRKTQNGKSVVQFTLAVNRIAKTQGQPDADFINCVAWNKSADNMAQYLHKGSLIGVTGNLQTRNYENNQGQKVYVTEVICNNVQFLESNNDTTSQNSYGQPNTYGTQQTPYMKPKYDYGQSLTEMAETDGITSDDLPFNAL